VKHDEQLPALSVDLGGTKIVAAVVGGGGQIISWRRCLTNIEEGTNAVLKRLFSVMDEVLGEAKLSPAELAGIAVACAGIIDMKKGVVTMSPNLPGFAGIKLRDIVASRFGVKTHLINDASAAALGEYYLGAAAGRSVENLVYLTVSTGIGGGIIAGGRLYLGADGCAGEIGHMVIKADGPLCKCGKSGCLEALASGWAVARDAKELLKGGGKSSILRLAGGKIEAVTAATVALAAREGDTLAQKIIADAAHYLGVGLANIVDIFNPELIVIGGGLAKMGNMLLDPARKAAKKAAFGLPGRTVRIVRARFVNNAGILGAAAYAFNQTQKEAGG